MTYLTSSYFLSDRALVNIYPNQHLLTFPANNSFDVGLAVFHAHYKISPYNYQKNADQVPLKYLMRCWKNDTDNDGVCHLAYKGQDDLDNYFYGKAYQMFMNKCPAQWTGFKKVQEGI